MSRALGFMTVLLAATPNAAAEPPAREQVPGFRYTVDWNGVVDEFDYATGWACASSGSISVVLGPGAKKCTCFEGYGGHVDFHLPIGPGARLAARGPVAIEIWADLTRRSGGRVPDFEADAVATLDADVPLALGAHVRGTASFRHEEQSSDGYPVTTSAAGRFDAVVCEDRPGALAALARAAASPSSAHVEATVAGKKRPIATALAGVERDGSGRAAITAVTFFPGPRTCAALSREDADARVVVRVPSADGRRNPAHVSYWTPLAGPFHADGQGRVLQSIGWLELEAADASTAASVTGSVFGRGSDPHPTANAIEGKFSARVCRRK